MAVLDSTHGTRFDNGLNVQKDELSIDNVTMTSTAAELNLLDGVTATMAELNLAAAGLTAGKFVVGEKFIVNIPLFSAAGIALPLFIAPAACEVIEARENHVTVCDAADTMTLEKVPSGTAPGGGTVVLIGNFTLNSTANTLVTVACHGTAGTRQLAAGNALMAKFVSGDGTNYAGAALTVVLKWI